MKGIQGLFEENVNLSCPFLGQVLHVGGWYLEKRVNFASMITLSAVVFCIAHSSLSFKVIKEVALTKGF